MAETSEIQLNLTTKSYEVKPKKRAIDEDFEDDESSSVTSPDKKKSKKNHQKGK